MVKAILAAITATVLLASSAAPSSAQYRYRGGYGYPAGGGTAEPEPLLASVSVSGSSAGLWQLLPTTRHRITERPVMASPRPSRTHDLVLV